MNNSSSSRCNTPEGIDVGHNIVTAFLLFVGGEDELLGGEMLHDVWVLAFSLRYASESGYTYQISLHLLDSLVTNRQSQVLLREREVEP
jgi:hypothetical protein